MTGARKPPGGGTGFRVSFGGGWPGPEATQGPSGVFRRPHLGHSCFFKREEIATQDLPRCVPAR